MADVTGEFYEGEAFHGYGTELLVGQMDTTPGPESFVAVADIETITPGSMETAVIEKTHLRSPKAHREKLLGLRDSAAFVMTGNWRPKHGSQSIAGGDGFVSGGLLKIWVERETRNYKLVLSDGSPQTEWAFRGGITKFQPGEIGIDGKVPFTCEVMPLTDYSASLP